MDVPAPQAGVVKNILVKVGDKVSEGSAIIELATAEDVDKATTKKASKSEEGKTQTAPDKAEKSQTTAAANKTITIPDIGTSDAVDVIDVLVKAGDQVKVEDPLITLEGDKATMDVPAPDAGEVVDVAVKVGDKVKQGDVILTIKGVAADKDAAETESKTKKTEASAEEATDKKAQAASRSSTTKSATAAPSDDGEIYAGPAVRRLAHEFNIDLHSLNGTGDKGRITKEDIKRAIQGGSAAAGTGINVIAAPQVDFKKYGEVDYQALSKIKKISGANLHRNWISIPHITQFDEADITEMEAFRSNHKKAAEKQGAKLTPLVFIMKAVVAALKQYPIFNSSLSADGEQLIVKKYYHIGVAVDTPNGLVVPVIRDVDQKGLLELAKELATISEKARTKGLSLAEMQGGCFTISSLGGIGGTAFTPIVNAPEVAILGVSKAQRKPIYQANGELEPRLMLPLSLSYDHRVIDGADGARFVVYLSQCLQDMRYALL